MTEGIKEKKTTVIQKKGFNSDRGNEGKIIAVIRKWDSIIIGDMKGKTIAIFDA